MHFLKRLELNGFKSFAGKTVLELPEGITAIVGPNGSGKSNIVDAVRWLLGEREARNLRGAKVEDLIFAGTPEKPRMGIAQAALHFENQPFGSSSRFAGAGGEAGAGDRQNLFPVEFAEVSIMRQVSRDGSSRYFLNKSEILLRDLVDFLAKARLGSRGMTVVTQGNSDVFIRSTPGERREMIEEVLGLREYQLKKLDAERRLKSSRLNLDKVKALSEEILPHLRSLKRQTSRWEKRGSLEEELRNLENAFFGGQIGEIKSRLAEIEKKIAADEKERDLLLAAKKESEKKQAGVEESQPKERAEARQIRAQMQELAERRNELGKNIGRIEAQIEMAKNAGAGAPARETAALLKEIREGLAAGLAGDMVELRSAAESAVETIDEFFGGKAGAKSGGIPAELESRLKTIRAELSGAESDIRSLGEREKELEKSQEDFYRAFKAAVAEVEAAKDKMEKWQAGHRDMLFEKERLDLRREEVERQISQAGRSEREFANLELAGSGADPRETEKRMFKLRGDLASIGEIDEALMKEATETEKRYEFLKKESDDLEKAVRDLERLIRELEEKLHTEFEKALKKINEEFGKFFGLMFGGGQARLKIEQKSKIKNQNVTEEGGENPEENEVGLETEAGEEEAGGVLVDLKLPRKKISSLEALSGGERSLVGIAAIFALISVSPPPFLVLDEIDAPLDERNARRFAEMLKEFSKRTQFVVVTHNRATMEVADVLYGVTLNEDGTSKLVSLKLE